jgi:hypothetical protein
MDTGFGNQKKEFDLTVFLVSLPSAAALLLLFVGPTYWSDTVSIWVMLLYWSFVFLGGFVLDLLEVVYRWLVSAKPYDGPNDDAGIWTFLFFLPFLLFC